MDPSKLSALNIEVVNFGIKNESLPEVYHLIVAEDTQFDTTLLSKISAALAPRGFVILAENTSAVYSLIMTTLGLQIVSVTQAYNKKYFLLKKVIYHIK